MHRLVHIGYGKTATSALQMHLFPQVEGINYVPINPQTTPVLRDWCFTDPLDFSLTAAEQWLKSFETNPSGPLLLSYERFVGDQIKQYCNRSMIANRLKALGFSKVLITLRNQPSWLNSAYSGAVYAGLPMHYHQYFRLNTHTKTDRLRVAYRFHKNFLNYHQVAQHYCQLFGAANVHILLMEQMIQEPEAFFQGLANFLETEQNLGEIALPRTNTALSAPALKLQRILNRNLYSYYRPDGIWPGTLNQLGLRKLVRRRIDPFFRSLGFRTVNYVDKANYRPLIVETFRESNQKLFEEFNLPEKYLSAYTE